MWRLGSLWPGCALDVLVSSLISVLVFRVLSGGTRPTVTAYREASKAVSVIRIKAEMGRSDGMG